MHIGEIVIVSTDCFFSCVTQGKYFKFNPVWQGHRQIFPFAWNVWCRQPAPKFAPTWLMRAQNFGPITGQIKRISMETKRFC